MKYYTDFRACAAGFIIAIIYIVLNRCWANLPEMFPGAADVDDVLYAISIGYIPAFVFFMLNSVLPRKRTYEKVLDEVETHINSLSCNLNGFGRTVGYNMREGYSDFFDAYFDDEMWDKWLTFSLDHPQNILIQEKMFVGGYIRRLAQNAEQSCDRINALLPGVTGRMGTALTKVAAEARLVQRQNSSTIYYPVLMDSIQELIEAYWIEHGSKRKKS